MPLHLCPPEAPHKKLRVPEWYKISKRGNRYLRVLFVQAAWVVLVKPKTWERHGLKSWIEAAKKRMHRNVLAIALATKKNAVINYCVILSYYTIDDCGSVIRGESRLSNVSKILL
jgi:Transposase IS116/IS110/IS902 family